MFPRLPKHGQVSSNKKSNNAGRNSLLGKVLCRPKFSEAVIEALEAQRAKSGRSTPNTHSPLDTPSPGSHTPDTPMSGSIFDGHNMQPPASFAANQWEAQTRLAAIKGQPISLPGPVNDYDPTRASFVPGGNFARPSSGQGFLFRDASGQTPSIAINSNAAFYVVDSQQGEVQDDGDDDGASVATVEAPSRLEKVVIPGGAPINQHDGPRKLAERLSHETGVSRHLAVSVKRVGLPIKQAFDEVVSVFREVQEFSTKSCTIEAYGEDTIFVSFANLDDAAQAINNVWTTRFTWLVDHATASEAELIGRSAHESQVLVTMRGQPPFTPSQAFMEKFLHDSAARCGKGFAMKKLNTSSAHQLEVIYEFSDVFDCWNFVTLTEGSPYGSGFEISVSMQSPPANKATRKAFPSELVKFAQYHPNMLSPQHRPATATITASAKSAQDKATDAHVSDERLFAILGNVAEAFGRPLPKGVTPPAKAELEVSAVARAAVSGVVAPAQEHPEAKKTSGEDQLALARRLQQTLETGPQAKTRGTKFFLNFPSIVLGQDVRTTVMLKNIPNKVDQAWIKEYLDQTSRGRYDFLYLRIDFASQCNVGYAFVNFLDPMDIVHLAEQRLNQRWNCYKSSKVAELAYANVQGRDELINKFRNSVVMQEPAHYRPKLFYAEGSPSELVGTEEEFPKPDNQGKVRRSHTQTEQKGLFTTYPTTFHRDARPPRSSKSRRN